MREMEHPDIRKSFLWHLSKAIGKISIAPKELAKQYLTNPSLKKQSTMFTFDKEELIKLRKDILENPVQYEQLLLSAADKNELIDDSITKGNQREEYEYWYRVINDGRCPEDNIKFKKELHFYKEYVNNVEKSAFNTMKLTIQRLLIDF